MAITIKHAKTNNITDWTQPQLDTIIAGGAAPLPPSGTVLNDVVLSSDWNHDHTFTGELPGVNVQTQMSITSDASGLKLVNDSTSPGNERFYGTNSSTGVKGWRSLPVVTSYLLFSHVAVSGQTTIDANSSDATLNIAAGSSIILTTDNTTQTLNIASSITQYTDEMAQDAVGAMVNTTLTYVDATPLLGINLSNANTWQAITTFGNGTSAGEIRLLEGSAGGGNYMALKAAATIAADFSITFPNAPSTTNSKLMRMSTAGVIDTVNFAAGAASDIQIRGATAGTLTAGATASGGPGFKFLPTPGTLQIQNIDGTSNVLEFWDSAGNMPAFIGPDGIFHPAAVVLGQGGYINGAWNVGGQIYSLFVTDSSNNFYLGPDVEQSGASTGSNTIIRAGLGATTGMLTLSGSTLLSTFDSSLRVKAGSSSSYGKVGGVIFDHFADVGNVGTGEDDLYSDTVAASILSVDGNKLTAQYGGIFTGAAASTQDLRVYFAGTKIYDSGALSIGVATNSWTIYVTIIRESSSVVRCNVSVSTDFATLFPYSAYTRITGLTLTNTQILKITGEAAGVGAVNNQIVAKEAYVEFKPAA